VVRGTRGAFEDFPPRIYLAGQEGGHAWRALDDDLKSRHTHPLWARVGEVARARGGHGGMDYVMAWRLAQCMREGLPPDMDVYDAAAWSAPGPLSERSVANRGRSVDFPDFTRGGWTAVRRTMS
jgi:hypothetical protein